MKTLKLLENIVLADAPFVWWEWDVINNTVTMNDLKVTMLGYHPDEFKGKGYESMTALLHPDDYENTMEAMRDLLSGKKSIYQIDYRIKDRSGHYHWYMDRGAVIAQDNDRISRIRGIVIDLGLENAIGSNTDAVIELLSRYSENKNNLIVICSSCRRVKISHEEWTPITDTFNKAIADTISHGICPACVYKLYPELAEMILQKHRSS
ncbi:MAG: PAS domain-containing protein [Bacteroidota bacterium]|jgi:PAS domain S-box-containing protein